MLLKVMALYLGLCFVFVMGKLLEFFAELEIAGVSLPPELLVLCGSLIFVIFLSTGLSTPYTDLLAVPMLILVFTLLMMPNVMLTGYSCWRE